MEIEGDGVDRVLMKLYRALLPRGAANDGQRGDMLELLGCWFPRRTEPVFPPRSEPPLSMVF
jgi:hypothetical protein